MPAATTHTASSLIMDVCSRAGGVRERGEGLCVRVSRWTYREGARPREYVWRDPHDERNQQ